MVGAVMCTGQGSHNQWAAPAALTTGLPHDASSKLQLVAQFAESLGLSLPVHALMQACTGSDQLQAVGQSTIGHGAASIGERMMNLAAVQNGDTSDQGAAASQWQGGLVHQGLMGLGGGSLLAGQHQEQQQQQYQHLNYDMEALPHKQDKGSGTGGRTSAEVINTARLHQDMQDHTHPDMHPSNAMRQGKNSGSNDIGVHEKSGMGLSEQGRDHKQQPTTDDWQPSNCTDQQHNQSLTSAGATIPNAQPQRPKPKPSAASLKRRAMFQQVLTLMLADSSCSLGSQGTADDGSISMTADVAPQSDDLIQQQSNQQLAQQQKDHPKRLNNVQLKFHSLLAGGGSDDDVNLFDDIRISAGSSDAVSPGRTQPGDAAAAAAVAVKTPECQEEPGKRCLIYCV